MTLLRHPVVITSLEEDFRKIGLITEASSPNTDEVDEACKSTKKKGPKPPSMEGKRSAIDDFEDEGDEEEGDEEEGEEDDDMEEARAFHRRALEVWDRMGAQGVPTFEVDTEGMIELESLAASVTELPLEVIGESEFAGEDEDVFAEDENENEDGHEDGEQTSVSEALSAIRAELDENTSPPESFEEAVPAFANLALIAEKLYGYFAELAEATEDKEYADISEAFKEIAKYSAAVVDTLREESEDSINFEGLVETFQDYLGTVLSGLEAYAIIQEGASEEQDEGNV